MKTRKVYLGVAVALAAAIFFTEWLTRPEPTVELQPRGEDNLFSFVKSMEGTRPDGKVTIAPDDQLVVDAELPRMFDYYLAALGEKSLDEIRAEIERQLDQRLKPNAAAQAKQLLARYLDFKRDLITVEKDLQAGVAGNGIDAIKARLEAIRQSRLRFFSPEEVQAMFGLEDAYDRYNVEQYEIAQNKTLTDEQKKEKLAALDMAMPPELRKEQEAPLAVVKLEESVQQLRTNGASDDDVYRMRAAALTPEAAARLAEVDRDEAAWKSRISDYLAERSKLLNANTLDTERQSAIQQLRDSRFNQQEQMRLPAYE
ncbi:lipase secretion chaperone [Noviherbaspirillum autotrophicum]|uniref:Lipase chaperone n=1 Tax=Noviherbaspirillum autotrophicum TaxID=709839 RepID=A0A0C2BRC1_9BURK|nr:lipase secretion chaperone [Noviherbaspirillum autotrophicum]KIF80616.1 lipase modulator protein [Noviherbaspirillum autotrophicum]